jgi:ribosomal protein S18
MAGKSKRTRRVAPPESKPQKNAMAIKNAREMALLP